MNAVIDAIYHEQQFVGREGDVVKPFPVSIKRNEGEALYQLVRAVKPEATLEVGMAYGLSTLFFCQALADNGLGHHTAIDPYQGKFKYHALWNVERAGIRERLTFLEESSQLALPRLVQENRTFGVIFIDGSHLFDAAFVDFFFADLLVPVGGYIVFDDLWMPAVRKVLEFVLRNRRYEIAEEFLGEQDPFLRRHLQNARYQWRKRMNGKRNKGLPSEWKYHRGRNVNWCVLRKTDADGREWDHFANF